MPVFSTATTHSNIRIYILHIYKSLTFCHWPYLEALFAGVLRHQVLSALCVGHRKLHVDIVQLLALGVAQHVVGSVLDLLVRHGPRATQQNPAKISRPSIF